MRRLVCTGGAAADGRIAVARKASAGQGGGGGGSGGEAAINSLRAAWNWNGGRDGLVEFCVDSTRFERRYVYFSSRSAGGWAGDGARDILPQCVAGSVVHILLEGAGGGGKLKYEKYT